MQNGLIHWSHMILTGVRDSLTWILGNVRHFHALPRCFDGDCGARGRVEGDPMRAYSAPPSPYEYLRVGNMTCSMLHEDALFPAAKPDEIPAPIIANIKDPTTYGIFFRSQISPLHESNPSSDTSLITEPIPITGTNVSVPPTPTSIETQSPRPSISVTSESEAPTETFPSISESEAPTTIGTIVSSVTPIPTTTPLSSSVIASASSALSSISNSLSSAASTIPTPTPTGSQNAASSLRSGAGWTVGAVLAGVAFGAALL
ncbi:hypothetical protein AG1IA_01510 [Rhizoctonia solani AG-1 IA]|uniref:Uncharacterized protein n=1 Tax=Thanatephorus cucumeris (strain AG1-IA) TaxID=983506 RepID=L8X744_THACA|nr:hypothetical protein AG1IA_01510 [Rhizoctonia solani AG-1 IA]